MFSTSRWMFVCVAASHYNFILFFFQSICFFSGVPGSTKTVGILVTLSLSEKGQRIKALFCRLKGFCLPSSQAQLQGIYYCRKDGHLSWKGHRIRWQRDEASWIFARSVLGWSWLYCEMRGMSSLLRTSEGDGTHARLWSDVLRCPRSQSCLPMVCWQLPWLRLLSAWEKGSVVGCFALLGEQINHPAPK